MPAHRHKLKLASHVPGYDRDARVYRCKVSGCNYTETRMSRGTRKRGMKRRQR